MSALIVMLDDNPDDLDIMALAAEEVPAVRFEGHHESEAVLRSIRSATGNGVRVGLLLDWHLPGDAAANVVRTLRADTGTAEVYVMVNSGSSDSADHAAAIAAGASSYTVKPAGFDESVDLIARLAKELRE